MALTSSDYLLVKYDAFNRSEGIYTISSYQLSDTSSLSELNSSSANVHTLEIPEMHTSSGYYFDLRDTIDFRVTANTTANTSVTVATDANMTINPGISVYADKINDTTEKYFPVPESDMLFDLQKYEGRTDKVVVNANGDFVVIRGEPASKIIPKDTSDALTLAVMKISEYPSLPNILSANTIEILDTSIVNIKYLNVRQDLYTITDVSLNGSIMSQPPAYDMKDIGSIDRRLTNVENIINFQHFEKSIKDLNIPSSIDNTDRFKFGFFADFFSDTSISEVTDPEYSATNFCGRITARKKQTNLKHVLYSANSVVATYAAGGLITLPFQEYSVARQLSATSKVSTQVSVGQTLGVYEFETPTDEAEKARDRAAFSVTGAGILGPQLNLTLSALTGPAALYFNVPGNSRWEIYQSTVPGFTPSASTLLITSESAQTLTNANIDYLRSVTSLTAYASYDKETRKSPRSFLSPVFTTGGASRAKYIVSRSGKITWTHDPAKGMYYIIRGIRYSPSLIFRLEYPVDSISQVTTATNPADFSKTEYVGSLTQLTPKILKTEIVVHKR